MKCVVDRFEGEYAVCETEGMKMERIPRNKLPEGIREGDVLLSDGDSYVLDQNETTRRKKQIEKLADELWSQ